MKEKYKDIDGDSGVLFYEILPDAIRVYFRANSYYTYSYRKAGKFHVEKMKILARSGNGLNSYIQRNVKFKYD